ncbi:hypothetical protein GIX45_29245 [Erwinia sp. CPCC 100877]|nr:hypothetical protein [Erwinia sp. CPCC 100877]
MMYKNNIQFFENNNVNDVISLIQTKSYLYGYEKGRNRIGFFERKLTLMVNKIILLPVLLVTIISCYATPLQNSNFSFTSKNYQIFILSNCKDTPSDCQNLTAQVINKVHNKTLFLYHGTTENTGLGHNLRGFRFKKDNLIYTIRQPADGPLDKWALVITRDDSALSPVTKKLAILTI